MALTSYQLNNGLVSNQFTVWYRKIKPLILEEGAVETPLLRCNGFERTISMTKWKALIHGSPAAQPFRSVIPGAARKL